MDTSTWILIAAGAVVVLVLLALVVRGVRRRRRSRGRSEELRERFGPEYDRVVEQHGRTSAESDLASRVDRYEQAPNRALAADERRALLARWAELQAAYVDDPLVAVQRAEALLRNALELRGTPTDRVDDRVTAAAFVRPELAELYRQAHDVFVEIESERATATSEHDQRQAFLVYRELVTSFAEPSEDRTDDHLVVTAGQPAG